MQWIVAGNINRDVVGQWLEALEKSLQQNLERSESYVLIWDNASFHLGGNLETIVRKHRIRIVQLPAYSPDLTPLNTVGLS